jgi:hypothetical protein
MAGLDVEKRKGEEDGGEQNHDGVLHFSSPGRPRGRRQKPGQKRSRIQPEAILFDAARTGPFRTARIPFDRIQFCRLPGLSIEKIP